MNLPLVSTALALVLWGRAVFACPCQGSSGPGAAVTNRFQSIGGSVTETFRVVHGAWNGHGKYLALAPGSRQWMLDFIVAGGYRPIPRVEVGSDVAFGRQSIFAPGFASQRTGFGDATFRGRWEALDEPMPYVTKSFFRPGIAVSVAARVPTGTLTRAGRKSGRGGGVASGTTGSIGASASSQSLGTWEPSVAVALTRGWKAHYRLTLVGEAAVRLPDDAVVKNRQLGPRLLGQLNFRYMATGRLGFGALTDLGWEAPVEFDGHEAIGSGQRVWNVGAYSYLTIDELGFRSGVMIRYTPPVDAVSVNAVGATNVALSIGYAH